jgi:hypothetical protein
VSNRRLGERKERVSVPLGQGRYRHSILLEPGTAPAAEQEQSVPADQLPADAGVSDEPLPATTDPAPAEVVPPGRAAREYELRKAGELLKAAAEEIKRLRERNQVLEETLVQRDQTIVVLKEERRGAVAEVEAAGVVADSVAELERLLNEDR